MNKIRNPIVFQGRKKKKNYFEGWYYKNISLKDNTSLSFIPGISLNESDPHAFVQVIKSPPVETLYYRYSLDEFYIEDHPFKARIGNNIFQRDRVHIDLEDDRGKIKGELVYSELSEIETSILTPNIMGFFAYIPNMECNHGVISMNHNIRGKIEYNNSTLDFDSGKGYIEKDWGRSFPSEYIWMQSNNFEDSKSSLMLSIAKIPMMGRTFDGHIVNVQHGGQEYRFASYNGSKVDRLEASENRVEVEFKKGDYRLLVVGCIDVSGELKAPKMGQMVDTIKEGLSGSVYLKMTKAGKNIMNMKSNFSGIEIAGYR